jgi:hypothetical protein
MTGANLNRLEGFAEDLPRFFYLVMAAALIGVLIGFPRSGLFLLIVGAAAHVVRASLEDFIGSQRALTTSPQPGRAWARGRRAHQ